MKHQALLLTLLSFVATCAFAADGVKARYAGCDISLLPSYETNGATYFDHSGAAVTDVVQFCKAQEQNAARVRLFVDPTQATAEEVGQGVRQSLEYITPLCKRIKDAGLALMLDFHYSDSWADPAKQWTPAAWVAATDLNTTIYEYTRDALTQLKAAGAEPDFIQTGNEISYGMLWGARDHKQYYCNYGSTANWNRFTTLLKNAGRACREVCPQAKIVLHIERVAQPQNIVAFFNNMATADVDYDIIGLSYYSYYHGDLATLNSALTQVEAAFPTRDIMIVETGYSAHWAINVVSPGVDLSSDYPYTDAGQTKFTQALINTLDKHKNVTGLFWWFAEANECGLDWNTKRVTDSWYNGTLFDNETGRAYTAFTTLGTFARAATTAIAAVPQTATLPHARYNIDGTPAHDTAKVVVAKGAKFAICK